MTVSFELRTTINAPIELVFDLSRNVDAHLASMEESGERAVGGVTTGMLELGDEVTWRAKHFGVPFVMTSCITEMDRPHRFVDEQVKGPFSRFRHVHRFEVDGESTYMTDEISFDAPLGPIGQLVESLFLGGYLEKLIAERNDYLKAEAERQSE